MAVFTWVAEWFSSTTITTWSGRGTAALAVVVAAIACCPTTTSPTVAVTATMAGARILPRIGSSTNRQPGFLPGTLIDDRLSLKAHRLEERVAERTVGRGGPVQIADAVRPVGLVHQTLPDRLRTSAFDHRGERPADEAVDEFRAARVGV